MLHPFTITCILHRYYIDLPMQNVDWATNGGPLDFHSSGIWKHKNHLTLSWILWLCYYTWPYRAGVLTVIFLPSSSLWCHYGKTPCRASTGKRHWFQHHRGGLNMIVACFFEPICLPLGVCASQLRLIPAGVTLTAEWEAASSAAVLCIQTKTCLLTALLTRIAVAVQTHTQTFRQAFTDHAPWA